MRVALPQLLLSLELSGALGLYKKPCIESNEWVVNARLSTPAQPSCFPTAQLPACPLLRFISNGE